MSFFIIFIVRIVVKLFEIKMLFGLLVEIIDLIFIFWWIVDKLLGILKIFFFGIWKENFKVCKFVGEFVLLFLVIIIIFW